MLTVEASMSSAFNHAAWAQLQVRVLSQYTVKNLSVVSNASNKTVVQLLCKQLWLTPCPSSPLYTKWSYILINPRLPVDLLPSYL